MACPCLCGASSASIDGLTDNGIKKDDGRLVFYRFVRSADCYVGFIQMKKIFLFAVSLLLLLPLAKAENIIQLTGGNYIYAEEGKLVFNIDPDVFLNRNWRYDASKGGATTLFYQKMDFKTRHSNDFHAYDMAAARKYYEDYHYAKSNGQNGYGFYKLVYTKEHLNKRHIRRVVWPAIWAGAVRIGAIVIENVVPRIVIKCLTNLNCRSFLGSSAIVGSAICSFHYSGMKILNLPPGICSEAEKDGYQKDKDGKYKKKFKYFYTFGGGSIYPDGPMTDKDKRSVSSFEEGLSKAQALCSAMNGQASIDGKLEFVKTGEVYPSIEQMKKYNGGHHYCDGYWKDKQTGRRVTGYSDDRYYIFIGALQTEEVKELEIVDLSEYIKKDFRNNPNPYINDRGELGKQIRKEIQPIQGDINTGGTLSIVGEPYRDGNGETKQDVITVNAPSDWSNSSPGGNASNPTGGISITNNNSNVRVMGRPDKEADSKPAANNDPNNGKSVGQSGGNTAGGGQSGQKGENCPEGSDSLACAKLGDIDANDKGFELPHSENGTTWQPDYFLQTTAVCPQPRQFQVVGQTYEFKYDQVCGFAEKIKYIVIVLATISAGFIVFGKKD